MRLLTLLVVLWLGHPVEGDVTVMVSVAGRGPSKAVTVKVVSTANATSSTDFALGTSWGSAVVQSPFTSSEVQEVVLDYSDYNSWQLESLAIVEEDGTTSPLFSTACHLSAVYFTKGTVATFRRKGPEAMTDVEIVTASSTSFSKECSVKLADSVECTVIGNKDLPLRMSTPLPVSSITIQRVSTSSWIIESVKVGNTTWITRSSATEYSLGATVGSGLTVWEPPAHILHVRGTTDTPRSKAGSRAQGIVVKGAGLSVKHSFLLDTDVALEVPSPFPASDVAGVEIQATKQWYLYSLSLQDAGGFWTQLHVPELCYSSEVSFRISGTEKAVFTRPSWPTGTNVTISNTGPSNSFATVKLTTSSGDAEYTVYPSLEHPLRCTLPVGTVLSKIETVPLEKTWGHIVEVNGVAWVTPLDEYAIKAEASPGKPATWTDMQPRFPVVVHFSTERYPYFVVGTVYVRLHTKGGAVVRREIEAALDGVTLSAESPVNAEDIDIVEVDVSANKWTKWRLTRVAIEEGGSSTQLFAGECFSPEAYLGPQDNGMTQRATFRRPPPGFVGHNVILEGTKSIGTFSVHLVFHSFEYTCEAAYPLTAQPFALSTGTYDPSALLQVTVTRTEGTATWKDVSVVVTANGTNHSWGVPADEYFYTATVDSTLVAWEGIAPYTPISISIVTAAGATYQGSHSFEVVVASGSKRVRREFPAPWAKEITVEVLLPFPAEEAEAIELVYGGSDLWLVESLSVGGSATAVQFFVPSRCYAPDAFLSTWSKRGMERVVFARPPAHFGGMNVAFTTTYAPSNSHFTADLHFADGTKVQCPITSPEKERLVRFSTGARPPSTLRRITTAPVGSFEWKIAGLQVGDSKWMVPSNGYTYSADVADEAVEWYPVDLFPVELRFTPGPWKTSIPVTVFLTGQGGELFYRDFVPSRTAPTTLQYETPFPPSKVVNITIESSREWGIAEASIREDDGSWTQMVLSDNCNAPYAVVDSRGPFPKVTYSRPGPTVPPPNIHITTLKGVISGAFVVEPEGPSGKMTCYVYDPYPGEPTLFAVNLPLITKVTIRPLVLPSGPWAITVNVTTAGKNTMWGVPSLGYPITTEVGDVHPLTTWMTLDPWGEVVVSIETAQGSPDYWRAPRASLNITAKGKSYVYAGFNTDMFGLTLRFTCPFLTRDIETVEIKTDTGEWYIAKMHLQEEDGTWTELVIPTRCYARDVFLGTVPEIYTRPPPGFQGHNIEITTEGGSTNSYTVTLLPAGITCLLISPTSRHRAYFSTGTVPTCDITEITMHYHSGVYIFPWNVASLRVGTSVPHAWATDSGPSKAIALSESAVWHPVLPCQTPAPTPAPPATPLPTPAPTPVPPTTPPPTPVPTTLPAPTPTTSLPPSDTPSPSPSGPATDTPRPTRATDTPHPARATDTPHPARATGSPTPPNTPPTPPATSTSSPGSPPSVPLPAPPPPTTDDAAWIWAVIVFPLLCLAAAGYTAWLKAYKIRKPATADVEIECSLVGDLIEDAAADARDPPPPPPPEDISTAYELME